MLQLRKHLYLLVHSEPRGYWLHHGIQKAHAQNLEMILRKEKEKKRKLLEENLCFHGNLPPLTGCTDWESVEQVCEHLSGQGALPPAHEGTQGLLEDGGDPSHIHCTHEPQLHTHGNTQGRVCVNSVKTLKRRQQRLCLGCVTERDTLDSPHWLLLLRHQSPSPFWGQQGAPLAALSPRTEPHCNETPSSASYRQKNVGRQGRRKVVFASLSGRFN